MMQFQMHEYRYQDAIWKQALAELARPTLQVIWSLGLLANVEWRISMSVLLVGVTARGVGGEAR